jgi:energy-coupling factor transport system substrate-specific component
MTKTKTWTTMTLAMIPICIAINFVGAQIANALKLPMYLDVIGTIMMGAICGPVPGMVLGALSSLINSIGAPASIAYIPATVAYGLLAGILGKKKFMTSVLKTIIAGLIIAIIGTIISSPITAYLYGGVTGTGQSVIIMAMQAAGIGLNPATVVSALVTEIPDKLISCFVVFFVGKALSDRQLSKFPLGYVYMKNQTVADEEE